MNAQLWESLLQRTLAAADNLTPLEQEDILARIERDPDCLTYTRDEHGWIEVLIAGEVVTRCHVFDLAPRPDAPFLN